MNLQMDPLDNQLSTRPILAGRGYTIHPDLTERFGIIYNLDLQFDPGSVPTQTRTRSDGSKPLLTLGLPAARPDTLCVDG